jgi:hypothetical protein
VIATRYLDGLFEMGRTTTINSIMVVSGHDKNKARIKQK